MSPVLKWYMCHVDTGPRKKYDGREGVSGGENEESHPVMKDRLGGEVKRMETLMSSDSNLI